MKSICLPIVILLSTVLLAASCLSTDDNDNITYYDDTAITAFSLGTLNREMHTTSSKGEDSVYTEEVDGSEYKFYIDQLQRKIYNPDSLPAGTDAGHVICNVSGKNSGVVVIKDVGSDTLRYYVSTDSIDFTAPREFRVYSNDGTSYRTYTVSVNVHKEDPDSFNWNRTAVVDAFKTMEDMKAVAIGSRMLVFGKEGNTTTVYSTSQSDGSTWTKLTTNIALDGEACKSGGDFGNLLNTVSGGSRIVSADGETWNDHTDINSAVTQPDRLIGATVSTLYGMLGGKIVSSTDKGNSWTEDRILGDASELPADEITSGVLASNTNANTGRIVIAGNRDITAFAGDSVAMVWSKIEEYADVQAAHSWMFCNENNGYRLPNLAGLKMMKYGDVLIAFGGKGQGTSTATAFSTIYYSEDNGLTWHSDGVYVLPEGFDNGGGSVFAAASDTDNYLWIISGGDGSVWRGRLNRLGWTDNQTSFIK